MASIYSIPVELLDMIASHVDDDQLANFRLVCPAFAAAAWPYFQKHFGCIPISPSKRDFDRVLEISSHSHIVPHIKELQFGLPDLKEDRDFHRMRHEVRSQITQFNLATIFEKLISLEDVFIRLVDDETQSVAQWMAIVGLGGERLDDCMEVNLEEVSRYWFGAVLVALRMSERSLESLTFWSCGSNEILLPLEAIYTEGQFIRSKLPVKRLHLDMAADFSTMPLTPETANANFPYLEHFYHQFFASFEGLTELSIGVSHTQTFHGQIASWALVRAILRLRGLTRLQLAVGVFPLDVEAIIKFCKNNNDTLSHLDLEFFHIEADMLDDIVRWFKVVMEMPNMETFNMSAMWNHLHYGDGEEAERWGMKEKDKKAFAKTIEMLEEKV